MDAQIFWDVISLYNQQTIIVQVILLLFLTGAFLLSYFHKINWAAKAALGITNLYIGIVFFGLYGTEPIQKFFALPLYLCCGVLFLIECMKNRNDILGKPNRWQVFLLLLFVLYPVISFTLGNRFPVMVTYVMPCPVISVSIAVYSCYKKRNRLLLILMTIWGLTGIKSLLFSAYEDMVLLLCGFYGAYLVYSEFQASRAGKLS